jgi:integrase/recombinase XerD
MLVNFMLATGLRLAEVCDTTLDDIDFDDPRCVTVGVRQGKGRKDRNVPLDTKSNKVSAQLRNYELRDRPKATTSRALFLTRRKDDGDYLPLSSNAIQTLCKRLSLETGIHVNPHKFRHTLGFQMARDGVSPMVMMKVFGHTSIMMSAEYVNYDTGDLIAAWNQRP